MSSRQLIVLGTSSQSATRERNHNGYALQWDDHLLLFDPGEGFQRQCLRAHVAVARADGLLISHFHGDHCLGLPGLVHRRMMEAADRCLPTLYPSGGQDVFDALMRATASIDPLVMAPQPIDKSGSTVSLAGLVVTARRLEHPVPTFGYRLQEPDTDRLDVDRLRAMGIDGTALGELQHAGRVAVGDRIIERAAVSLVRPGQSFAYVLDSALCDEAVALANGVDLLICESTFLEEDRALARPAGHMTARDAGWLARESGARRLVLTHFSARYDDLRPFALEAGELHPDVVVARDLMRVDLPTRRSGRGIDPPL